MLTHGPESVAEEFQTDKDVIGEMEGFQHIDEKGFNWGLAVRKKAERILKLLEKGPLLKEERDRARKLTREIRGFGSFSHRSSSAQGMLKQSPSFTIIERSNSQFNYQENQENLFPNSNKGVQKSQQSNQDPILETQRSWGSLYDGHVLEKVDTQTSFKENMAPIKEDLDMVESNPLLNGKKDELKIETSMEDHPFSDTGKETTASLLV